jgi:enoyl-CoA hydratase/carnithine racemase
MDDQRIRVSLDRGVADVRLVRADKMNALDDAMFEALRRTGDELKATPGVRVVVLSGEGRAFCAGLDTANFGKMASGERGGARLLQGERTPGGSNPSQHTVMAWRELPVPVIAAVHGVAYGGGFQLMLAADIRFMHADTRLSIMEINWGLVPDMGGMALLRGLLRDDIARELTYTGRVFSGDEAHRLGLSTHLSADPYADALALARQIADRPPRAMRAAKRLFELAREADAAAILLAESTEQAALIGAPEQVEAVTARLQKRAAVYADPAA